MQDERDLDIDYLVSLLDEAVENGNGHLEVISKDKKLQINNEFTCTSSSCCVPTLHEGVE